MFVEYHETTTDAILREKRVDNWPRASEPELIASGGHSPADVTCTGISTGILAQNYE
jgi:predicted GIY-YIG superfamily endonuclease